MLNFDAAAVRRHLPWPRMLDALEAALQAEVQAPLRTSHVVEVPGTLPATLLMMPAWRRGRHLGVKLVTVFPGNAARGQRSVAAVYVLFDATDGRALALFDGEEITARRTAGASAYAARHLARSDARHLVMVGAGHQALGLVAAHCAVRPIERVSVWSRNPARAEVAAASLRGDGLPALPCTDLEAAVRTADVVSCATLARAPVVQGAWLRPGTHVDLVGAFRADMRETDDAVWSRAGLVVVDERKAVLAEGGDVVQALASGAIKLEDIAVTLADLACGRHAGRTDPETISVFKSVGFALEDLAAAEAVYEADTARR